MAVTSRNVGNHSIWLSTARPFQATGRARCAILRHMTTGTKIVLIGTGGTIAGIAKEPGRGHLYADSQLSIADVAKGLPRPPGIKVEARQVWKLGSEDFTESNWRALYLLLEQQLRRADVAGVVVTQGTDTLEETAFFLSRVLHHDKPVVLTGAMRPSAALSSDAAVNIYQSVALAASDSARGKGVLVVMNERIHSPADLVKNHTFLTDSFVSAQWGPLGVMIGESPKWARWRAPVSRLPLPANFGEFPLPRVDLIWAYAGIHPDCIEAAVAHGARGIVYAGTGNGNIAVQVKHALARAIDQGCTVIRASRTLGGDVIRNASEHDDELRTVAACSYAAIKARILLQLGLSLKMDRKQLQALFEHA